MEVNLNTKCFSKQKKKKKSLTPIKNMYISAARLQSSQYLEPLDGPCKITARKNRRAMSATIRKDKMNSTCMHWS